MFRNRIELIETRIREFLSEYYGIEPPELIAETPPQVEMGDLAFPFPFQLAKVLRKSPLLIAREIAEQIGSVDGVERFEAAGGGFLNIFLNRESFFKDLYEWLSDPETPGKSGKIIVEHTNINPNKAAHIGHLRNAVLGDTFVRLLVSSGREVEVQNYIDNTGVQVADVVVGFHFIRKMSLAEVAAIEERFDYYCWDLYAQVSEWYDEDPERKELRQQVLHAIEEGLEPFFPLAEHISIRIVRAHLQTMGRLGVHYDVLPRESEILHLKFWEEAYSLLKERRAIEFIEEGPHAGCWVMQLPGENGQEDEEKIIVRSNGTVTYVGKDIAYQLWKFGLLGKTFHYSVFDEYEDGSKIWITSMDSSGEGEPRFGAGDRVYNVIDVRQSYLQRVVVQGLRSLGYSDQADRSTHFSYEMVALSPRCCSELGIELSEEDQARPYVEVSGRKGLGVKADDLIDKLFENSLKEVNQRQADLPQEARDQIARQIAVGALRYFMLKYTRNSVIAFDFAEALSFEGETGPYLQYSIVRSSNIFRKLFERYPEWEGDSWKTFQARLWDSGAMADLLTEDEVWRLVLDIARIPDTVEQAITSLEISGVARHAFTIAQQFNLFYHKHHILSEEDESKRAFYLSVTDTARQGLLHLLDLLGIEVPERM
ncbi:MAG: arginine--tRNA ligase [Acidobacteriota bacterium]|nr:MAG: arginine--tRNA ligase [Acidobacteriota bacterium]